MKGAKERSEFYVTATHILFAIILGHSFLLAPDILVPISNALEPANHTTTAALVFSYIFIVSSWIGYARSVSFSPHKDTGLGATRFVLNLIILYEFFYLLRISQTEHIVELPAVVVIIFGTYLVSDVVKYFEYDTQDRARIIHRGRFTGYAFALCLIVIILHNTDYFISTYKFDISIDPMILTIAIFAIIAVLFRVVKWRTPDKRL